MLAGRVGISRSRLAVIEAGRGNGVPAEVWFALGEALGIYLRFEFGRDPLTHLADAGHLDIQELALRASKPGGWLGGFELRTRATDPSRSVDVPLIDQRRRRLVVGECWNTFGDLGAAVRSSDRKVVEAADLAVVKGAQAGEGAERDGEPYQVGLCWIVRDTKANRALVDRYQHIFKARFPGSSAQWIKALTRGGPMPKEPGLIWCDVQATRLFARRAKGGSPER